MHPRLPDLPEIAPLKAGIYKHYKGGFYRVVGVATHETTHDQLVVYREISRGLETGEGRFWVRPLNEFYEHVEFRGKSVPRFQYVSEK